MKSQLEICVKKFGGTSVGTVERIKAVAQRIVADQRKGQSPVVVASAMAGETNRLVDLAHRVNPLSKNKSYDLLVASGEQVSIALLSMAFEELGIKATPYLGFQLGVLTDSSFSKARIQEIKTEKVYEDIKKGIIPVLAGFQGVDSEYNITTLGRGGSDTSAVAMAAALKASACEIYTDVDGVYTADPRLVKGATKINRLCFEEMIEMASLGSKVLHIRSVELAAKYGVHLHVRSSFVNEEGTWVSPEGENMETPSVTSVTHDPNITVIKLWPTPKGTTILTELFGGLAKEGVVVDIINQSRIDEGQRIAFSIPSDELQIAKAVLSEVIPKIEPKVVQGVSKLSIVGVGMRNHPGVAAKFFEVLSNIGVEIELVTTSEIKVSAVIAKDRLDEAANALHKAFELGDA